MPVKLKGATSGDVTLDVPAVAGSNTLTLPAKTGNIITSADSGTVSQAMLASGVASNGPAFSAYSTTFQTITTGVETKVTLNAEEFDTNNCFDAASTYKFQPTVAGYYHIIAQVRFNTDGQQTAAWMSIYKNGALYRRLTERANSTAGTMVLFQMQGSALVYFNGSSDYIELYVYVTGTGTLQIGYTDPKYNTYLQGFLVRAA